MKWPLSKLYKITPPTRLHLISRDKPDSFSSRRSLLVAAFSYIIKKCIPPHPSRYSPFIVMRYARNLAVLLNYRSQRSLIFTPNKRPRGTPIQSARAGEARPRGKAGSERRKACFHPGGSGFHLPRGRGGSAAFQFYQLDFYVTRSLLWYFLGLQESTVPPSSPIPSHLVPHSLANLGCLLPRIAVT